MSTKSKTQKQLEKINGGPFTFKDMLYSFRVTDEVTQQELADSVGVPRSRICDFEKGRRTPSIAMVAKLAKALGYPAETFILKNLEDQLRAENLKFKITVIAA